MADSEVRRNLELLATAAGVAAVLLPLGGVLVRIVAFWSLDADNRREIVLGDSIPSLALTGFQAVLASAGFLIVLIVIYRAAPITFLLRRTRPRIEQFRADHDALKTDADRMLSDLTAAREQAIAGAMTAESMKELEQRAEGLKSRSDELDTALDAFESSEEWKQLNAIGPPGRFARILNSFATPPSKATIGIGAVFGVALTLLTPDWPAAVPLFLAWVIVFVAAPWLAARGVMLRFTAVFIMTAVVVALSAIGSGFSGTAGTEYVAYYDFKPDANLSSGRYVHLTESNGHLWLQDCSSDRFVEVDSSSVAHVNEASYTSLPDSPSLWDVFVHNRRPLVGYRSEC